MSLYFCHFFPGNFFPLPCVLNKVGRCTDLWMLCFPSMYCVLFMETVTQQVRKMIHVANAEHRKHRAEVLSVKLVWKTPQIQSFQVLVTSLFLMVTAHAAFQRNIDKDTHLFLVHFCYSFRFETHSDSVSWGEQFWIIIAGIWMAQTMNTLQIYTDAYGTNPVIYHRL